MVGTRAHTALVFVKPHASGNAAVLSYVKAFLAQHHVRVKSEGFLSPTGEQIDAHYAQISHTAMTLRPSELNVSDAKKAEFSRAFGVSWWDAISSGSLKNYRECQEALPGLAPPEVERLWRTGDALKLGSGLYVARVDAPGSPTLFVVNGFYGSMRYKYVREGAQLYWMVCEFDFAWKNFRASVIGATDPAKAQECSIRAKLLADHRSLGLPEFKLAFNGVHASAGPVEAARERMVWLGVEAERDVFGIQALGAGLSPSMLRRFLANDEVELDGASGRSFDLTEDMDTGDAIGAMLRAR